MKKLIKILMAIMLTLIPYTSVAGQTFNYEGTYLTQDTSQAIQGFHFDTYNNQIFVLLHEASNVNISKVENFQRLVNIRSYIESHYDFQAMSKEEISNYNINHGIDYAAALQTIIDSDNEANANWEQDLNQQIPGIHDFSQSSSQLENSINYGSQSILINQPKINFNQNMWNVSMFDISSPVLRFQGSSQTDSITDDFGIVYTKQD